MRTTRKGRWLLSQPRSGARVRQGRLFIPDPYREICRKRCPGPTAGGEGPYSIFIVDSLMISSVFKRTCLGGASGLVSFSIRNSQAVQPS